MENMKNTGMPSGLSLSTRVSCVITRLLLLPKADEALCDSLILGWACRSDS